MAGRAQLPVIVSKLKLRRAFRDRQLLGAFEAWLSALPEETQGDWSAAVELELADPETWSLIENCAIALSLTTSDRDAILRAAAVG